MMNTIPNIKENSTDIYCTQFIFLKSMEVLVQNFRCWKKFSQTFPNGISLLAGKSGCGKSSILDAISWAMYGKVAKVAPRTCPGSKTLVRISFQGWMVERCRKPNRLLVKVHGQEYTASSAQSEIEKAFGSYSTWLSTCYISQGNMVELLSVTPVDRLRILEELFCRGDIDKRDKRMLDMKKDIQDLSAKTKDIASKISAMEYKMSALASIHGQDWLSHKYAESKKLSHSQIDNLQAEKSSLEDAIVRYSEAKNKLHTLSISRERAACEVERMSGDAHPRPSLSAEVSRFVHKSEDDPHTAKSLRRCLKMANISLDIIQRIDNLQKMGICSTPSKPIPADIIKECKDKQASRDIALGNMKKHGLKSEEEIPEKIRALETKLSTMDLYTLEYRRRELLARRDLLLSKIKNIQEPTKPTQPFGKDRLDSIRESMRALREDISENKTKLSDTRAKISVGETAMNCPECGTNLVLVGSNLSVFEI